MVSILDLLEEVRNNSKVSEADDDQELEIWPLFLSRYTWLLLSNRDEQLRPVGAEDVSMSHFPSINHMQERSGSKVRQSWQTKQKTRLVRETWYSFLMRSSWLQENKAKATKCSGDLGDCNSERCVDKFLFSYCADDFTCNRRLSLSEHTSGRSDPAFLTSSPEWSSCWQGEVFLLADEAILELSTSHKYHD